MNTRYSMRGLFLMTLVAALGITLLLNLNENRSLKSRIEQLQTLSQQLASEVNRLADCETELHHFRVLAAAQIDSVDVALDAQRRKIATQLRIVDIKQRIECLLDPTSDDDSGQRRQQALESEAESCRVMLNRMEKNPSTPIQQISLVKKQLAFFEAQTKLK